MMKHSLLANLIAVFLMALAFNTLGCSKKADPPAQDPIANSCTAKVLSDYHEVVDATNNLDADKVVAACTRFLGAHGTSECSALVGGVKTQISYNSIQKKCDSATAVVSQAKDKRANEAAEAKSLCSNEAAFSFQLASGAISTLRYSSPENYLSRLEAAVAGCRKVEKAFENQPASCRALINNRLKWISYAELANTCSEVYGKSDRIKILDGKEKQDGQSEGPDHATPIAGIKSLINKLKLTVQDGAILTTAFAEDSDSIDVYFSSGKLIGKHLVRSTLKAKKMVCGLSRGEDLNLVLREGDSFVFTRLTKRDSEFDLQKWILRFEGQDHRLFWITCLRDQEPTNADILQAFGPSLDLGLVDNPAPSAP